MSHTDVTRMLSRADYLLYKSKASLMVIEHRCNVCYKVYTSMLELGMHLEYPYNCNLCGKYFTILGPLKNHEKHHIVSESLFTKTVEKTTKLYDRSRQLIERKKYRRGGIREGSGRKPLGDEQANGASREVLRKYKKDKKTKE